MGRGMARNLHKAGLLQAVWNRTPSRAGELAAELGVVASSSLGALARACDTVVTCVSADADVLEVVDGLLPGLRDGALVIDCSTVSADTAREAARRLASARDGVPRRAGQRRRRRRPRRHARDHGGRIGRCVRARQARAAGHGADRDAPRRRRAPDRRPRPPTRSSAPARSRRSPRRWPLRRRRACRCRS